jgi:MFS family permease
VRASAQGLFGAACFGVAPAIALTGAGFVTRHVGLQGVFAAGAVASAFAALLAHRAMGRTNAPPNPVDPSTSGVVPVDR